MMWTALISKEVREALGIVAAATLAYFFLVAEAMQLHLLPDVVRNPIGLYIYGRKPIPFLGGPFPLLFFVVSAVLAFGLGLWQAVGEGRRGTYLLLLHLPWPRARIIAAKLVTGVSLYLVLAALPLLIVAWWAATPGTHASPFEWSMTDEAWRMWFAMVTIYLGAFLSGLRPARWVGTRLLPAFACGFLIVLLHVAGLSCVTHFAVLAAVDAVLIVQIMYIGQARDYS
jgi:hypothetical protein